MKNDNNKSGIKRSLILALAMFCAVFVGCGNKDESSDISSVDLENISIVSESSTNDNEIPELTKPQIFETLPDTGLELPDDEWEY